MAGETRYASEIPSELVGPVSSIAGLSVAQLNLQDKVHHDYLIKEMLWMQEDFERERKKKQGDAKKQIRMCRKELSERLIKK